MDRTLPVFVLLPAVVLLIQGASCLRGERAPFVRWFGVLAIALAGLDVVLALLLLTGTLVPSREFDTVMVKGPLPYLGLLVLQVGMSVIAGLGWHVSRMAAGQVSRLLRLMVAAVLVAASAVYWLDVLNPVDPAHARVYSYDLLWPPLLLWVGLCFFESCYAIARLRSRLWRVWADSALVVAPAVWALESSLFVADEVKLAWRVCLIVFLPLSTGLGAWLAIGTRSPDRPGVPLKLRLALSVAAAAIGLWIAWPSDVRPVPIWLIWPAFPVLVGMLGLRALWKVQRAEPAQGKRPLRPRQVLSFVALVVIAGTFAELVYFSSVDPLLPLIIFIVAWTVEAEATASGLLTKLGRLALSRQLWTEQSPLRHWAGTGLAKASAVRQSVVDVARALFAMPSVPVAAVKFLVLVLALIVLTELPNARQTVVEPFTSQVKEEGAAVQLGPRISDRVLNAVALIDQRLRSDTVRLLPRGSETEPAFKLVPASAGGETAFAKGSELDLGYVKMPATFVLAVTRDPVRAMMGVRVITGAVQVGPTGYEVLARSSTGETWRIEATEPGGATSETVVSDLAERLAFEIVTGTDRSMRLAGLTHSWKAYKHFRKGLDHWQEYETGQHAEDLSAAIGYFREATRNHPTFALAFYRLGLALQRDGQPAAAEEALRTSLRINENLVPAYLALASTLYNHDEYLALLPAPAVAPSRPLSTEQEKRTNRDEAKALWLHVIHRPPHTVSDADRAAAFYGLCNFALDTEKPEEFGTDARDRLRRLAYYYCQRAEHLYAALPAAEQQTAPIKEAEASVLNALGRVLTRNFPSDENLGGFPLIFGGNEDSDVKEVWRCRKYGDLPAGPLRRPALRYLEQAEALAPLNEAIKCRTAWMALSLGQAGRMRALEVDASARVRLARRLAIRAKRAKPEEQLAAYPLALTEYSEAIKLNPTMFTALNGFASTFWEWRLVSPKEPGAAVFAQDAETYARWALEVAKERRSTEDIIVARATLGNVLLAQARPLEAIDYLEEAHDKVLETAPKHARWNEVRWSLAQAYLCAGENDIATGVEREPVRREKAVPLLDKIRDIEQTREWRPFSSIPTILDPVWNYHVCLRNPRAVVDRQPSAEGPFYVLSAQRPSPKQNRLCDRMGVSAEVTGLGREDYLQLRVWGGGVSRELPVVNGQTPKDLYVQLHSPPRASRQYYFAQLEDRKGRPVSEVNALHTYSEEGGRCTGNLTHLVFYSIASAEP